MFAFALAHWGNAEVLTGFRFSLAAAKIERASAFLVVHADPPGMPHAGTLAVAAAGTAKRAAVAIWRRFSDIWTAEREDVPTAAPAFGTEKAPTELGTNATSARHRAEIMAVPPSGIK